MFLIFADIVQDLLQRNHLELLKFTGSSYQEVLEIQRAVGKAIIPKVQTVSTDFSHKVLGYAKYLDTVEVMLRQLMI